MTKKVLTLLTNYNNKLDCNCFLHLDDAPPFRIRESELENTEYEIRTADGSHQPIKAKLVNMARVQLWKVCDVLTFQSHGIDSITYQQNMIIEKSASPDKEMAVYFYQKIG
jgi:hypothetical protein